MQAFFSKENLSRGWQFVTEHWREPRPRSRTVIAVLLLAVALFCLWQSETAPPTDIQPKLTKAVKQASQGRTVPIIGGEAAAGQIKLGDPFLPDHPALGQGGGKRKTTPGRLAQQKDNQTGGNEHGREAGQQADGKKKPPMTPQLQGIIQSEEGMGALLLIGGNTYLLAQGEAQGNVQVLTVTPTGVEVQQGEQVSWFQLP